MRAMRQMVKNFRICRFTTLTRCIFTGKSIITPLVILFSQLQDMPLTPGILWTPSGSGYKKSVMTHGCSFSQLQWLYYLQETELCIDQSGNRIQIEHAYHRGEVKRGPYKIDGYFRKDNQDYFLEFLGTF